MERVIVRTCWPLEHRGDRGCQHKISDLNIASRHERLSRSFAAYIYAVRALTVISIIEEAIAIVLTAVALVKIRSDSSFRKLAKHAGQTSASAGAYCGRRF